MRTGHRWLRITLISLFLLCSLAHAGTGPVVGHVVFARGGAAALAAGEPSAATLLETGAEVFEGDVIQTGHDSFVILEFSDKARVTVRPDSRFRVDKYATGKDAAEQLFLEQGGVRMAPGEIAKTQPAKFQLQTPQGSVKTPKGSAFSARLCQQDCALEQRAAAAGAAVDDKAVARVIRQEGVVDARGGKGGERLLSPGSAVYEGESIRSQAGSSAVLLFRDEGKVTVEPNSTFEISEYRYQPKEPSQGTSVIRIVAGGIRALTGLIGKAKQENVKFLTPVATVGIRGTGLDGYYQQTCAAAGSVQGTGNAPTAENLAAGADPAGFAPCGFYSTTWLGVIEICNTAGCVLQREGQSTYTAGDGVLPQIIPNMPEGMQQGVRPDLVKQQGDGQQAQGVSAVAVVGGGGGSGSGGPGPMMVLPGLYVVVDEAGGRVSVEGSHGGNETIGDRQTAFVDGSGQVAVWDGTSAVLTGDPCPLPNLGLDQLQQSYSPLTDQLSARGGDDGYMCKSQ